MKILLTFAGVGAAFGGIFLFYLFLISLNDQGNILFFLGTLFLFGLAVYLFIFVTKEKPVKETLILTPITQEVAEKNLATKNDLINQYEKIEDTKSKLKMLEAAGSAASDASGK